MPAIVSWCSARCRPGLYSVNLLTGDVDSLGHLRYSVSDIAVNLDK